LGPHASVVEALAFAPDGASLAVGGFRELTVWDLATGSIRVRLADFADRVLAVAYSPDGKLLATGGGAPAADGELKLFDATTGRAVLELPAAHGDTVFGVSFSPDGKLLATAAADKLVKVWELPSGKAVRALEGHTHHVLDVGWRADGKALASAGADGAVKVWDAATGERLRTLRGPGDQL